MLEEREREICHWVKQIAHRKMKRETRVDPFRNSAGPLTREWR